MKLAGKVPPAYFLYRLFWEFVDWVFPPTCGGCGMIGERWCNTCQMGITRISGNICPQCGEPQAGHELCPSCQATPPDYCKLRSFAYFKGPIRKAMHRLKYQKDIGLGEALSNSLIELYNVDKWRVDVVVPVPLSSKRQHDRGYNQASLLGRPLAYAIRKPFRTDMLLKKRETQTQVGLSAFERKRNVEGAFFARPTLLKNKTVLLIDDVTTTGSTISACAQALREAGASAVYGLTLARAVLQADADDQPNPSQSIGGNYGS
jgi:competence protein ComFC